MHEVGQLRDVTALTVSRVGRVQETGNASLPYRLLDRDGVEVAAVSEFLLDMLANDDSPASLRSYAYELLAWFRFLWAVEVAWDRAGRVEARDFALWLQAVKKPPRPRRSAAPPPGSINPVTGKRYLGEHYAARTRRHARAVVRSFYEYHRETYGRPLLNPFPRARRTEDEHLNAHHNPMHPFRQPARRAPTSRRSHGGHRAASPTRRSTSSSPRCPRTATGPWSRSTSRPARGPRNCSG